MCWSVFANRSCIKQAVKSKKYMVIRRMKGKSLRESGLSERLADGETESHWSMCEQLCINVRVFVRGKCEVMVPLGEAQHSLMSVH